MLFVPIILVYLLLNFYIGWHGSLLLAHYGYPLPAPLYWVLFWIVAFSYLLGRVRLLRGPIGRLQKVIGSYYFGVLEFAVILLPIADLTAWLLDRSGVPAAAYIPVIGLSALILLIFLFALGTWNAWSPVTRRYEIVIKKQAGDLHDLRIAMASDIHLGNIVGKRHLRKLVSRMNDLNPDLILLPGDVIDDDIEPFIRNRMSDVMQQLKARYGIYAVLGNHEYYGGHIEEYVRQMSAIGIRVLQDESVLINDGLYIVGRKDKAAESMDPARRMPMQDLLDDVDTTRPVIVMDHQPYHFDKALAAGVDLLLCGHTHRGQFAPNHWVTGRLFELDWGYLLKEPMHIIVSSGFGTWGPPIRIASRSEIAEIIVRFETP